MQVAEGNGSRIDKSDKSQNIRQIKNTQTIVIGVIST